MSADPRDLDETRAELDRLRAERARSSRVFYSVIPLGIGVPLLVFGENAGTAVLGLVFATWGAGTALGFIPAAKVSGRYYANAKRIQYLEGYEAGLRRRDD